VMEGQLDAVIVALQRADYEEKLAALTGHDFTLNRNPASAED